MQLLKCSIQTLKYSDATCRFTFVDNEKVARLEVEEAVGQLLEEMQELREGTAEQVWWCGTRCVPLRYHMPLVKHRMLCKLKAEKRV